MSNDLPYFDPLWSELQDLTQRLEIDPWRVLHQKDRDYHEGLNMKAINQLSAEAGIGPIMAYEDSGNERVVTFHHPYRQPLKCTAWSRTGAATYPITLGEAGSIIKVNAKLISTICETYLATWMALREKQVADLMDKRAEQFAVKKKSKEPCPPKLGKEAIALAIKVEHPEWSDKQVAENVPCNVKSLYRFERYQAAKGALEAGKKDLPKGSKYQERIEAEDSDFE